MIAVRRPRGGVEEDIIVRSIDLICMVKIDYSEELIKKRYKKELLGQLGNLLSRSISPSILPQGYVPSPPHANQLRKSDATIRSMLRQLPRK